MSLKEEGQQSKKQKIDHNVNGQGEADENAQQQSQLEQVPELQHNSDGESFFQLGTTRRITIRKFKGKVLIDIREYYEKKGESLPGKKGISLTLEQYEALRDLVRVGAIDEQIGKAK